MHFAAVEVTRIYDSLMEQLGQMKKPNSASPAKMAELIDTLKETMEQAQD